MRTSRMLMLLMELGRAPRTSVAALAERHGVTARTIQRDIAALHEMGVPVWTRSGPGGGVGLVDGWRSPITGMTATELQALLLGETGAHGMGLLTEYETARLKMLSVPTADRAGTDLLHERFVLDNERWFSDPERPAALPDVARAVRSGRRLAIRYARSDLERPPRRRLVDPLGLVLKTDTWYLVAAHRGRPRTYRLSRIVGAQVLEEQAHRPAEFSLREHWHRSRAEFESSVRTLPVRLSIPEGSLAPLRAALPGVDVQGALETAARRGQRLELALRAENLEITAAQLLAVDGVEVIEPPELRRRLHERGRDLAARHAPRQDPTVAP
ncbi:YafY family protein [Brachybacterium sp. YJGR34]|uniref:helix-turn-helix transcriptional regulator n=1 Tax=Brachybacterium sp. YJGR34 TaxID=2059911 RepID=UPI0018E63669|nr:WYL domain-containing protein [Brachybacterium sp. YJGR34]